MIIQREFIELLVNNNLTIDHRQLTIDHYRAIRICTVCKFVRASVPFFVFKGVPKDFADSTWTRFFIRTGRIGSRETGKGNGRDWEDC